MASTRRIWFIFMELNPYFLCVCTATSKLHMRSLFCHCTETLFLYLVPISEKSGPWLVTVAQRIKRVLHYFNFTPFLNLGSQRKYRKLCQKIHTSLIHRSKYRSVQSSPMLPNEHEYTKVAINTPIDLISDQMMKELNDNFMHFKVSEELKATILWVVQNYTYIYIYIPLLFL